MIEIYTDGACTGNPGAGAAAFIIIKDNVVIKEFAKAYRYTTNNRMEMLAIFFALKELEAMNINPIEYKGKIKIFSDSSLVVNTFNQNWLENWKRNNWRKSDKKPVLNQDIWKFIDPLNAKYKPIYQWVKGHNGDEFNERVDKLATSEVDIAKAAQTLNIDKNYETENEVKEDLFTSDNNSVISNQNISETTTKVVAESISETTKQTYEFEFFEFKQNKNDKLKLKLKHSEISIMEIDIMISELNKIKKLYNK